MGPKSRFGMWESGRSSGSGAMSECLEETSCARVEMGGIPLLGAFTSPDVSVYCIGPDKQINYRYRQLVLDARPSFFVESEATATFAS